MAVECMVGPKLSRHMDLYKKTNKNKPYTNYLLVIRNHLPPPIMRNPLHNFNFDDSSHHRCTLQ